MKRIYIKNTARKSFKDYKSCQDVNRVKSKIKESRKVTFISAFADTVILNLFD